MKMNQTDEKGNGTARRIGTFFHLYIKTFTNIVYVFDGRKKNFNNSKLTDLLMAGRQSNSKT